MPWGCDTQCVCCHSIDGHPLPIDELKGIKAVKSIDLSGKKLRFASAIIIGACIAGNAHLRELKYACHLNLSVPQGHGTLLTAAALFCSLDNNQLCGLYKDRYCNLNGTYTTVGIVALCEGIKQSNIRSLR